MNYSDLEEKINLKFKDKDLLLNAFVHRSYLNEHKDFKLDSNERLEFLGDACLELIVSEFLYRQYAKKREGILTNYRSSLVNTESLAKSAKELNLGNLLLLSRGEEEGNGRESVNLLADTFEALLGASYLEAGLEKCEEIIKKFLLPKLKDIVANKLYQDAKSHLQELAQELMFLTPQYKVLTEWGPDHEKRFNSGVFLGDKKIGEGEGNSKQKAEISAAEDALEKWKERM